MRNLTIPFVDYFSVRRVQFGGEKVTLAHPLHLTKVETIPTMLSSGQKSLLNLEVALIYPFGSWSTDRDYWFAVQ